MMDRTAWTVLAGKIDTWWPATDFDEDTEQSYFEELQHFDVDDVEAAVRMCLLDEDCKTFAPSLARLMQLLELPAEEAPPTWNRVLNRLRWATRRYGSDGSEAIVALAEEHAAIAEFVREMGWDVWRAENIDDPQYGGAVEHRLKEGWHEFTGRWEGRRRHDRVQSSLQRSRAGRLDRSRNPRRMDPATVLSLPKGSTADVDSQAVD